MHPDHIPDGFGPLLGYCDHQACRLMVRRLRRFDVSPMQCRTLTYLHRQTGDVTQKMLQQHLMVRPSTVNGIVDRLEEKGLVTRSTGKTDGRCRILRLTEKGKHFNDDFTTIVREVNEEIEHCFTREEVAQMRELLLRLAAAVDASARTCHDFNEIIVAFAAFHRLNEASGLS